MALDARTADKLVKLLGMLGSDHPGEVAAAGAAASRLLKASGLTWSDVIFFEADARPGTWREPENWIDAVRVCLDLDPSPLTTWDLKFLKGISRQTRLSEKQQIHLDRITDVCRSHSGRAA